MKKHFGKIIILMGLFSIAQSAFAAETKTFNWPKGTKAAVNLAYDDALNSQLDIAIPALDKYGFKGSFYLSLSAESVATRLTEWRTAANNGHELGNHTLFHQCSGSVPGRDWVNPAHDLDKITMEQMRDQILLANIMLHAIDGKRERTFTIPCGDLMAAGKNYLPAVKQEFVAVKATDGGVTPNMLTLDPYFVGVDVPVEVTGKALIARVKEAAKKGTMVNFTFHGIGGDYLTVSKEAHEELLKYLAKNKDIYWVDTFINIMKHVNEEQKKL